MGRKKQNYQKYSNIEQYRFVCHSKRSGSFCELPTSDIAKKINDIIDVCLSKKLKRPYLRFMSAKTEDEFIFYTDTNKSTHLDGWQTFDSVTQYLSTISV